AAQLGQRSQVRQVKPDVAGLRIRFAEHAALRRLVPRAEKRLSQAGAGARCDTARLVLAPPAPRWARSCPGGD
ncbi:hypothetical protein, partial [Azohydromonas lata]|uniref:hypothetical protein n=1 Tax=Azohydromonas lata TaxID=45677 RepID=UPI001C3F2E50